MSNLGIYQTMTTVTKRFGGPKKFIPAFGAACAIVGYPVLRAGEWLIKKGMTTLKEHTKSKIESKTFTVHSAGKSNVGLVFNIGDTFRILERDGDAVLIEKIGDTENPHFVSAQLLYSISDYR